MDLDKIVSFFFGTKHERDVKKMKPIVEQINALEAEMSALSNEELANKTNTLKAQLAAGKTLDDILPEAFAVVREASVRTLGMRHYDVQLMGGIVLHQGRIAEMKTGEGKTLVATLAVYLNALSEKGVHVVTVNDYLARRDAEWMTPVYEFLGLTVGAIQHDMDPETRQQAYAADITYGTNNEFGFDYLRDNMVEHQSLRVQRKLNFAIVDEVDSILIDEARTPLIISGSIDDSTKKYYKINKIIPSLKEETDYEIDEKDKNVTLTEDGVKHVEKLLKIDNLYDNNNIELVHHVNQALKAHTLFKKDVDYIVKNGEVVIVDEFTGRLMEGRRFSEGLHQALEAKENVTIARESQTLASVTFQNFFRMYNKLSGMTGTADTEAVEFNKIYSLDVVVVPTNKPIARLDMPDKIYRTEREKFNAIADEIEQLRQKKQPVLVGTISIERSEALSNLLKKRKVPHNVLNAKFHEREAEIVAEAGRPGAITIATNMAGRGTDIVLGGSKHHKAELDNYLPAHDKNLWNDFRLAMLASDFDKADELVKLLEGKDRKKAVEILRYARDWEESNKIVLNAGGLHILGTERHESRRIDNQLRGRSGRQGDSGSSQFYLSLEDDLMRVFGSDRISGMMSRLGMEEGQEIESSMVSNAVARAQRKVEGRNFDIRKHLLEYDDVMNAQREYIYRERDKILAGENIENEIYEYMEEIVFAAVDQFSYGTTNPDEWDLDGLHGWFIANAGINLNEVNLDPFELDYNEYAEKIVELVKDKFRLKSKDIGENDMHVLERLIALQVIDTKWREHLYQIDILRDGIWTESFGQKNPLLEYKKRGFEMFEEMTLGMKQNIVEYLMKVQVRRVIEESPAFQHQDLGMASHAEVEHFGTGGVPTKVPTPVNNANKDKAPTVGGVKRKKSRRNKR